MAKKFAEKDPGSAMIFQMDRRAFLDFSLKAALCGIACGCGRPPGIVGQNNQHGPGSMASGACSQAGAAAADVQTDTAGVLNLCLNTFTELQQTGGTYRLTVTTAAGYKKTVSVTRVSENNVVAVDATCTHQGCTINGFDPTQGNYLCPCHGSVFGADGSVKTGPATIPLTVYPSTLNAEGVSIQF